MNVSVRPASMDDAVELFMWRNDAVTIQFSKSSDPVPYVDHMKWLKRILPDPERILLIGMYGNGKIGVVRFEPIPSLNGVMVSITVSPKVRGAGLGRELLRSAMEFNGGRAYYAEIKSDNAASKALFTGAGFVYQRDVQPGLGLYLKEGPGVIHE